MASPLSCVWDLGPSQKTLRSRSSSCTATRSLATWQNSVYLGMFFNQIVSVKACLGMFKSPEPTVVAQTWSKLANMRLSLSGIQSPWALGQTGPEVDEYFGSSGIGGQAHSQPGANKDFETSASSSHEMNWIRIGCCRCYVCYCLMQLLGSYQTKSLTEAFVGFVWRRRNGRLLPGTSTRLSLCETYD